MHWLNPWQFAVWLSSEQQATRTRDGKLQTSPRDTVPLKIRQPSFTTSCSPRSFNHLRSSIPPSSIFARWLSSLGKPVHSEPLLLVILPSIGALSPGLFPVNFSQSCDSISGITTLRNRHQCANNSGDSPFQILHQLSRPGHQSFYHPLPTGLYSAYSGYSLTTFPSTPRLDDAGTFAFLRKRL